jgi:exodeoxyribonuclease V alpha subunit
MSGGWSAFGATGGPRAGAPLPEDVVAAAGSQDLPPELVHLAWEIARLGNGATSNPHVGDARAVFLLALAVLTAQRDGSTRVPLVPDGPLGDLLASLGAGEDDHRAARELLADGATTGEAWRHVIGAARSLDDGDYAPLLRVGPHLASQRLWRLEQRVIGGLRELLAAHPRPVGGDSLDAALDDVRARPARDAGGRPIQLTDEQQLAVRAALGAGLTAITGGPGTGKTWIVAALLRVVARLEDPPLTEVALAAPTGKAADRLQGSLRTALASITDPADADRRLLAAPPAATTVHRLLSYSPAGERFLRHERNPLSERLVLVDESSMLDLALAERLVRSLPAEGRLVLLGDARQLPSVEAGAVFRDLVDATSGTGRVARLTHSWRMDPSDAAGSAILAFAGAIASGDLPSALEGATRHELVVRERAADLAFRGAELLASPPATLASFLVRWWTERVTSLPAWTELATRAWRAIDGRVVEEDAAPLAQLFGHHEASRLLTVTRGWSGGAGMAALNAWFRATLARSLGLDARSVAGVDPLPGEPVLVTHNDYRRALYNGDQGLVLSVAAEGAVGVPMAVLRAPAPATATAAFRVLPLASLRGVLEPAWASTVHKAQGSEHDAVAVVLPVADTRLLTRELLYTAVTRARRSVVVVGAAERLATGAARAVERWSGIAEALYAASEPAAAAAQETPPRKQLQLPF